MIEAGRDPATSRLDNFVDAAFAFALTLLVIAGAERGFDYAELIDSMRRIPAFIVGSALIGLFWFAHVGWRRAGGRNGALSVVLSLALVLTVLVYVHPMRLMAAAFVDFLGDGEVRQGFSPRGLFTIYGLGFGTMAALVWGLYARARSTGALAPADVDVPVIWALMAAAGMLSALLAQFDSTMLFAPWIYTLLSVAVPLALSLRRRGRASAANGRQPKVSGSRGRGSGRRPRS